MSEPNHDKQLDELLDSMLSNYSAVDPRPGLETRVLASLEAGSEKQRGFTWRMFWLWSGAAAALAMTVLLAIHFARPGVPQQEPQVKINPQPIHSAPIAQETIRAGSSPTAQQGSKQKMNVTRTGLEAAVQKPQPHLRDLPISERPAIFPTPVALTEQERLMFAYISNTPREEVIAQIQKDDQKEAAEFWQDHERASEPQRAGNNR